MKRPVMPSIEQVHWPAPMGIDTVSPAGAMPPDRAILMQNLISSEYGRRVRSGYKEWVTGFTGAADNQVRSVMPFYGSAKNGSKDRIFIATSSGIWDGTNSYRLATANWQVTHVYVVGDLVLNDTSKTYKCTVGGTSAGAGGPTGTGAGIVDNTVTWDYISPSLLKLAFVSTANEAGWGISTVMVTSAGHFLIYCDEENGLYVYTESTDTWAQVTQGGGGTQISGVNPANFVYPCVFKNRLWFAVKDSAQAWYMGTGAIYGAATQFDFANKFRAGGPLVGLWDWTIDSGIGVDDSLIGISGGGDVVIYQGSDPANVNTFGLKGIWSIGAVPYGRRIATSFGGDLLILNRSGAVQLSKLVMGVSNSVPTQYATKDVANVFNSLSPSTFGVKGWSIRLHPEDNVLVVTVPSTEGVATTQLVQSVATQGWSTYPDLPIYSCDAWARQFYFGTTDGRLCINTGYIDNVLLADSSFSAINWGALTAFQNLGNARMKKVEMLRPTVLCDGGIAAYSASARYSYDLTSLPVVSQGAAAGNTWDHGVWDTAKWSGAYSANHGVSGTIGMGTEVAIAISGAALSRTVWVGTDIMYRQGGLL